MSSERLPAPQTLDEAVSRMREVEIPGAIMSVLHRLADAGFHGVVVGGAVRDALLGAEAGDWDVASNATPQEVIDLFPRTIPTGLEHGTVTVLSGRGEERHAVEITTFRGEGAYHDGRRPSEVRFLRDLEQDLARRDLTINAFAWDPVKAEFTDAFAGLEDLRTGLIRAVGEPERRFAEDGLRTMRAVRFAATMGFRLAPETEAAIAGALEVFAKVSRERVRVELIKMLKAPRPSLGLLPMAQTGLWDGVIAPLEAHSRNEAIAAVDRLPRDPMVRLARLLWPLRADREQVGSIVDGLKPSREERTMLMRLTDPCVDELALALGQGETQVELDASARAVAVRRAVAALDRRYLDAATALLELDAAAQQTLRCALENAALTTKELAIKGRELIAAGVLPPGPRLGELLAELLEWVLEDPTRNDGERLLAQAQLLASAANADEGP